MKSIDIKGLTRLVLLFAVSAMVVTMQPQLVNAVSASDWKPGNIIDDALFYDNTSMSTESVDAFIKSKLSTCDTNGTRPASEYGRPDITHAQYAALLGWPGPPYVCLRDYRQMPRNDQVISNFSTPLAPGDGSLSAAEIIKSAADTYGISPKTLLVTLQKESPGPLFSDSWPLLSQYKNAMGYGCPDTAPCDPKYEGFYNQMMNSAWQFRYYKDHYGDFRYKPFQNNSIQYNPNTSCGSSPVYVENFATAGLYNYTPYQPNPAALNNMYGYGDGCSAYGNRNFWRIYNDWFGTTSSSAVFSYSLVSAELYSDSGYSNKIQQPYSIEPTQVFYAKITIRNTGNRTWQSNTLHLGTAGPLDRSSIFTTDAWMGANRPPAMSEDIVEPNSTATFRFSMKAPAHLGDYAESFGVLIEGYRWLNGTFNLPITIASSSPYYSSQPTSFEVFSDAAMSSKLNLSNITKYTGSKIYVKIIVKNTGNQTWPAANTRIGTTNPVDRTSVFSDSSWVENDRPASSSSSISPQNSGTFSFSLTLPNTPTSTTQEQFGLLIENQQWINQNIGTVTIKTIQRPPCCLSTNQTLGLNQFLLSSDERYKLILQDDGNLVLYSPVRALWATYTMGRGARLIMQGDGNLVLYDKNWAPVWNSGTSGRGASSLFLQSDGNVVTYNSQSYTWASWTAGRY